jgi:ORF6N domain
MLKMEKQIIIYSQQEIENRIFTFRGISVMIDRDLAEMYHVDTKRLNEQVKRNIERFPEKFRFQLSETEKNELVAICDRFQSLKHSSYLPYAFTEQGVAMLSAVLKSQIAVTISIQIIDAFVEMRKTIGMHSGLLQRMDRFEIKQAINDQKFEQIFKALELETNTQKQGVFFDGQTFDAYTFTADLIRTAKKSIQLIDNYIDDSVLLLLSKRTKNVKATIYTKAISSTLKLDLKKHNTQYEPIEIKTFDKAHDRFLIVDETKVYHIGASLKDLGNKWFAFSLLDIETVSILDKLKGI